MKIKPILGNFALNGIECVASSETRALVEHRVPGLEGNYFQDMGSVPNAIIIIGSKHGDEARDNFLTGIREIFNKGEPTTFVADINTATDITDVIIEDLQVAEVGGSASSFRYLVKLRKYVKPPEPPSTDLLDTSLLDDALNVVDALEALDALGSIPNLGDPTLSLREALSGVQAATSELPGTVEQVQTLTQALPTQQPTPDILAPVLGDEAAGTGVAGVLKLLQPLDTSSLSVTATADLDRFFSANVSVNTTAITDGTLEQFKRAVSALPHDPATLTAPLSAKLEDVRRLSASVLSQQLLGGVQGLHNVQSLIPADTRALIAGAAERMAQLKGEFIRGEFGELRQWSESVRTLHGELAPLLASGPGTLEDRLLAYLRDKITALVRLLLPQGNVVAELSHQLDTAIAVDLLAQLNSLKAELIGHMNQARVEFDSGNFTNTTHLASAHTALQQLTELLTGSVEKLRPILTQDVITPAGLARVLQQQFDDFAQLEVIDVGNIRDKFAAAIKRVEDAVRGLDLTVVRDKIDGVFAKIDETIGQFDLRQFTAKLSGWKDQLQAVWDAIDGALFEAVASMRGVFAQIKEALQTVASALGSYDAQGQFHFHMQQDIEDFLNSLKTTLRDTIQPLLDQFKNTIGQILQQVQTGLNAVKGEIDQVKAQLQSTLEGIQTQLQSVDVEGTMASLRQKLDGMLNTLGTVDFDVVAAPVIAQINEMRDALKKIDVSSLNEFTIGALKVSVQVVVQIDFSAQISSALMAEVDKLLEIPKGALAEIEGKVEGALKQFSQLAPEALLAPLDDVFKPVNAQLDALKLDALLKPLDDWHVRMQTALDKVSPAALLQPLIDLHAQLQGAFHAVSPAELVRPLQEAIDGIKAEVQKIDVTSIVSDLGSVIDQVKALLDGISPARLLAPMVNAFDKIMGALDKFDPSALLQPFAAIFDALAAPLANLTADHARVIREAFAALRDLLDAFDPRRVFQMVRDKFAALQALVQQLNVGGLIAALKTPYDALHASFAAHGGPAHVSVSASVEGLNPLRNASIAQVAADFQRWQTPLNALAQAQPPAELVSRYDEIKPALESLLPTWAKENISPASIRRAFQLANPLSLKGEIAQLYDAIKQQVRTFDPHVVQAHVQDSFDRLTEAIFALDPQTIAGEVQSVLEALTQRLDGVNVQLIADELQGLANEVETIINGLDPQPIIAQMQGLVDEVKSAVESLQPSQVLAELHAPFDASKALVAEFTPAVFKEALQSVFENIQHMLKAIDLGAILQPLADRLTQLRDALEQALKRTETAFNGMLAAIPV